MGDERAPNAVIPRRVGVQTRALAVQPERQATPR
jgi:hypothetical protein